MEKNRSSVLRWSIPFAVAMVVVLIILSVFSVRSNAGAKEAVAADMSRSARCYARELSNELEGMGRVVKAVCGVLEQEQALEAEQEAGLLRIIAECTEASRVAVCDSAGNGIDHLGNAVSIGEEPYFQTVLSAADAFLYLEEDAATQPSVLAVERLAREEGQFVLLFYPIERFGNLLCAEDLPGGAFLALLDAEGRVLSASGDESAVPSGGNLLESVRSAEPEEAEKLGTWIANDSEGVSRIEIDGESRELAYAPLGMYRWGIVFGVKQAYMDRMVSYQWKNTRSMLIALIVVVFVFGCIIMAIDIIGRIRDNQQKIELENKADTDLLTGLNNKLATERKIKNYMEQNPTVQSMMFLLDVDNFKTVNDTMGHAFGDEVLSTLGEEISAIFRASDIIGRVGGDEFMIFLKGVPTPEVVRKEAKKVEDFFRSFQVGEYVKYDVRASIGVAVFPHEGADFETLYKAADQGLYKAKRRGKNQLAFYEDKWGEETAQTP